MSDIPVYNRSNIRKDETLEQYIARVFREIELDYIYKRKLEKEKSIGNFYIELKELNYDPNFFIDAIKILRGCRKDVEFCNSLGLLQEYISNIRNYKKPISAMLLIYLHEETGITIRNLRLLMGDRRKYFSAINLTEVNRPDS